MSLLSDIGTAIKNKLGGTSVDNTVPRYDGTTCKLQGSGVTISDTNAVTASGGFVGNLTGNASTATKLNNSVNDWGESGAIGSVVGMLAWKNFYNGHVIFDASASIAPNGAAVNNTNTQVPWTSSYPTLMGWNGGQTFGVRVDSARVADSATTATTAENANKLNGQTWNWSGQGGQPTWLWGGSDGTNMYVYNPANFSVANATTWGGANKYVSTSAPSGGVSGDIWLQYS